MGFIALLVSCGTSKETTSATANSKRGQSNLEATTNTTTGKTKNSRIVSTDASSISATNRIAKTEEKMNLKRMYNDLDMTDTQINRFEKEWNNTADSWKRNNPNKAMNSYERVEYQDRILRDILDDSQFDSYRKWVIDNAEGN